MARPKLGPWCNLPPVSSRSPRTGATNDFCFPGLISFAIEQSLHKSSCHHFKYFIFFSYLFKQRKSVALSFLLDSEMFSTVFVSLSVFKSSSKQKKYSLVFGFFSLPISKRRVILTRERNKAFLKNDAFFWSIRGAKVST